MAKQGKSSSQGISERFTRGKEARGIGLKIREVLSVYHKGVVGSFNEQPPSFF